MKSFKEYLTENQKVYTFKVKIAGELPESFEDNLKEALVSFGEITIKKEGKTPIQKLPLDFPDLSNQEVHIFSVMTEYPITSPQITKIISEFNITEDHFRVRGALEPSEIEQITKDEILSDKPLMLTPDYEEVSNAKHDEYYGEAHTASFIKELEKLQKERAKEMKDNNYGHALTGEA